jgi:hypothetical protein
LYPTLTQLAIRRKRIVHNADLPTPAATISEPWQLVDTWQLIMWLLAVSAFYYQLCVSIENDTVVEKKAFQNHMDAMHEWHNVAKAFIRFPGVLSDQRLNAIKEIADMVKKVADILPLDRNALIAEIPIQ